jgi:hypothetical protein
MSNDDKTTVGWYPAPQPQPPDPRPTPAVAYQLPIYLQPTPCEPTPMSFPHNSYISAAFETTQLEPVRFARPSYPQYPPYAYSPYHKPEPRPLELALAIPARDAKQRSARERARFVQRTYRGLLLAVLAVAVIVQLLTTNAYLIANLSDPLVTFAFGARWNWAIVLGAFVLLSLLADVAARHSRSGLLQSVGLALYVVVEAVVFVPLLVVVASKTHGLLVPALASCTSIVLMSWSVIRNAVSGASTSQDRGA